MTDLHEKPTIERESPPAAAEKPVNEIMKSAALAKEGKEAAAQSKAEQQEQQRPDNRTAWIAAGVGVGSAAVMGALLYANRARGKRKDALNPSAPPPPAHGLAATPGAAAMGDEDDSPAIGSSN